MDVVRSELPPIRSALREWHRLHGPMTTKGFRFVCLSDEALGILTHHDPDSGVPWPCQGDDCRFNHANNVPRFRAYMPGMLLPTCELFVAEITEGAYREMVKHQKAQGGLRGLIFWLHRKSDKKRSPVMAEYISRAVTNVAESFDPLPHMLRKWGLDQGKRNAQELAKQHRKQGGVYIDSTVNMGDEDGESGATATLETPPKMGPTAQTVSRLPETTTVHLGADLPELRTPSPADCRGQLRRLVREVREAGPDRSQNN